MRDVLHYSDRVELLSMYLCFLMNGLVKKAIDALGGAAWVLQHRDEIRKLAQKYHEDHGQWPHPQELLQVTKRQFGRKKRAVEALAPR